MKTKRTSTITVGFVPLGCPKNVVDSEKMLADIAQAGMLICADPDAADVIIINTCGFIEPAKAESIEAIQEAVQAVETYLHDGITLAMSRHNRNLISEE